MAVKTIQSVENALVVIEALAGAQPIGVSALARLVDLDKNAVQRILITLGQAGWIRQADGGEWSITSRALQIGTHYTSGLRDAARPHLEELQRRTGETVLLFARDGLNMVVVDAIDSSHALRMTVPVGTVVPISADLQANSFFVLDDLYPNAIAAGAPVLGEQRGLLASITVVGPRVRVSKATAHHFGELAAATSAAIAISLGERVAG
jgi:IclR family acetate operon transcriptional repressor